MNIFIAAYPGECWDCGGQLLGQECTFTNEKIDRVIHVRCPDSPVEKPKDTPLCQRCWTYHNGECA